MAETVGWIATAMFAASYFCRGPVALRIVQASAAAVWIAYGVMIGSRPVVAANVAIASLSLLSSLRKPK